MGNGLPSTNRRCVGDRRRQKYDRDEFSQKDKTSFGQQIHCFDDLNSEIFRLAARIYG